jgi:hypothetical protein
VLVGGESKVGSTEDEGIGGSPVWVIRHDKVVAGCSAQPRPINLVSNDNERPSVTHTLAVRILRVPTEFVD